MEKYKKSFSHNLPLYVREDIARWIRAIRCYDQPEYDHELHRCGIMWFTALGRTQMHDKHARQAISGRLTVIERQRARNKMKETT